jgi:tetratricopeptide (TPR) repeat protein
MKARTYLFTLCAAAGTLTLAACNGPTKAGIEAREEARARIDEYGAKFTYDQAKQDFETGQFDRALKTITAAIEAIPDAPEFHLLQGRILLEMNELQKAVQAFHMAVEKDDKLADAHYYAGIVFQRWSDDEKAFEHYNAAYEIDPDQVAYLIAATEALIALGEFEQARTFVEGRLDYFESNSAMRHLLGQIALFEDDRKKAARLYSEALMLDADNDALLEELAWVQYEAGLYGDCHSSVKLLQTREDQERLDLMQLEARCLTMLDRAVDAHVIYSALTRRDPSNASVWIEFGTLAWKLGDFRRVAQCGVRTMNIAPDRFEGYMLKGLYERNEGRFDEAAAELRHAAGLAKGTVLPHLLLGRTLEQAGHAREALTVYGQAMKLDPESTDARSLYSALSESMHIATAE